MSCPATSGHCHPFPPPQTSLIVADSHHVSPSVDTVNATNAYLHSPLSCPTLECHGRFWGRLTSDICLTVWEARDKWWKNRAREKIGQRTEETSSRSPPGGFHLQQQRLQAQLGPELCLPLALQSVHCDASMKGCAHQVLVKFMCWFMWCIFRSYYPRYFYFEW